MSRAGQPGVGGAHIDVNPYAARCKVRAETQIQVLPHCRRNRLVQKTEAA